jgi:hypothetical protein
MRLGMTRKTKPTTSAPSPIDTVIAKTAPAAFALVQAEIRSVPASAIVRTNLSMERAARRGLAVAERIRPLFPALAGLPDLDYHAVETMPSYALAVLHAHDLVTEGGGSDTPLVTLLQEAAPLREVMLRGAELLALAGYFPTERVAAIRSGQGYADTADDLQALGRLYGETWARVHDKVPVTKSMIERAITLSAELNRVLGGREIDDEDPLTEPSGPVHLRAQAFTLFLRAYEECFRGVAYLRWHHGDAAAIVPSLYPRRTRRSLGVEEAANDGPDATTADLVEDLVEARSIDEPTPEPTPAPATGGLAMSAADALAAV